jgi:hypothetical protein
VLGDRDPLPSIGFCIDWLLGSKYDGLSVLRKAKYDISEELAENVVMDLDKNGRI